MSDHGRAFWRAMLIFVAAGAAISYAMKHVGQPWDSLLLALGFASFVWMAREAFRFDRLRDASTRQNERRPPP